MSAHGVLWQCSQHLESHSRRAANSAGTSTLIGLFTVATRDLWVLLLHVLAQAHEVVVVCCRFDEGIAG